MASTSNNVPDEAFKQGENSVGSMTGVHNVSKPKSPGKQVPPLLSRRLWNEAFLVGMASSANMLQDNTKVMAKWQL